MPPELHLPDLPDVPVTLGPAPGRQPRAPQPWGARLREWLSGYLPLLLMLLLALATWWLARHSLGAAPARKDAAVAHVPDYTLDRFHLERFDAQGALKLTLDGEHLKHYPDDDMMEVETLHVVLTEPEGRRVTATARQGRARGDGSEIWLDGQAQVVSEQPGQPPVQINGEHLRALPRMKRVESDAAAVVQQGTSVVEAADGLEYDQVARQVTLRGHTRATYEPATSAARRVAPAASR